MATLHQIANAPINSEHSSIGPIVVDYQSPPKTAKNGKLFSTVLLKSAGTEVWMRVWNESAMIKLPKGEIMLQGSFTKEEFQNKPSIRCDVLNPPKGSVEFTSDEIEGVAGKTSLKECLEAGIAAADFVSKRERPNLAEAAFTFAANATLQGLK